MYRLRSISGHVWLGERVSNVCIKEWWSRSALCLPDLVILHGLSTLYRCSLTTLAQDITFHEIPLNRDWCHLMRSCTLVRPYLTMAAGISSTSFVQVSTRQLAVSSFVLVSDQLYEFCTSFYGTISSEFFCAGFKSFKSWHKSYWKVCNLYVVHHCNISGKRIWEGSIVGLVTVEQFGLDFILSSHCCDVQRVNCKFSFILLLRLHCSEWCCQYIFHFLLQLIIFQDKINNFIAEGASRMDRASDYEYMNDCPA